MDTEEVDPVATLGEFSLEDTHDHLKEVQKDLHWLLDQLMNLALNNDVGMLISPMTPEIIESKQCQFFESLMKNISDLDVRAEPMNDTNDLYEQTIQELEDGVRKMEVLEKTGKQDMGYVRKEVIYLENERKGMQWMKQACIGAIADVANSTYDREIALASRLFAQVKEDLGQLVAATTVSNEDFQEVLADLTSSHMKGGNEVYIDVNLRSVDCVNFLIEADVAAHHRNNKKKIRLMDLI
ncbi:uncharacterized protein LOC107042415 [Diachasma alloeum]|uniref:uncharacterized protein LOC107042415 n=1 Tax=Diachasma alloeum TaxID=454923 RepID=UPI000738505C|nr:uncharacterized protein LOC107042415 [Diachasma alloeum]